jgi:plasmid stabilization system protein ParE
MATTPTPQLSDAQARLLEPWLAAVLHDLVKYLELVPRSLDWGALAEEDAEPLYEAIFETRVDRQGAQSARDLWEAARARLDPALQAPLGPLCAEISAEVARLMDLAAPLVKGVALEHIDTGALRDAIFGIGDRLRALRR